MMSHSQWAHARLTVPRHISGSVFYNTLPAIMEVSRFCRSAISEPKNSRVSLEGSEVSVKVTWSLGVESLLLFTWGCKTKHAHANINMHKHTDMVMIKYICKICTISQKIKIKEMDLINWCTWKTLSKSSTWLSKTWCTIRKSQTS